MMKLRYVFLGWILAVFALTLSAPLLSLLFVLSQFRGNAEFPPKKKGETSCAIVFGSAVHEGREAGPGIRRRVDAAATLFEEGNIDRLILSGGIGEGNALSEAKVMEEEAMEHGVPKEAIILEESSTSTWENIKFAHALAKNCDLVLAVSDRYHLARIRIAAIRQHLDIMLYPSASVSDPLFEFREVLRESLGVLVYLVRK
jgi:uncharacterized SAM-binding protein YcdF (DUF218 family)